MKILICDDHQIVRDGLRQILKQLGDDVLISEAKDASGVYNLMKEESYDILLLDISLPGISGLEILQTVKEKWSATNVLILSMHPQEQYAIRAMKLGASGYLTKDTASEELLLAVQKVSGGGKFISQSLAERLALLLDKDIRIQKHEILSTREFEIMIKLANGIPLHEIGEGLFISVKTVSTYRSRIMTKMGMKTNPDLTRYCMENRLI